MDLFCQQIDAAGKLGLDIVCLPEKFTKIGTTKNDAELAHPVPGADTERLGAAAKRNHIWVVASLCEIDGGRLYNAGVLIDRDGQLKGKYRKVHLPLGEWKSGVVPGNEYPVFETDFGKVAIQICYDWFFPEIAAIWGLKGAEIVFAPPGAPRFPTGPTSWTREKRCFASAPSRTGSTWSPRSTTATAWSSIRWARSLPRTRVRAECSGARSI